MLDKLITYLEFARKSFQLQLQYRMANYSGFVVNTFFFMVRAYVFMALYEHRGVIASFSLADAVTFTGLTQAMIMTIGLFGGMSIEEAVRSGEVATDLMKPIDYQLFAIARQAGKSFYYLFFRGLPIFMVMVLFFPWVPPVSSFALFLFFVSLVFASLITFSFEFMVGLSAFWLLDTRGIRQLVFGISILLSGFLVPIPFFPEGLSKICAWLPFIGQSYVPVAIYLGKYTGAQILSMFLRQVIWSVMLILCGRVFWGFAVRKVVIQGG